MSQDIISDCLNQIMNAKKAKKNFAEVRNRSKFLFSILAIGKLGGYIKDYKTENEKIRINFGENLNFCKAVKPRYVVKSKEIEKYVRRYLPSRDMGILIVSTSRGLMTHQTALKNKIGGSIIAYFY